MNRRAAVVGLGAGLGLVATAARSQQLKLYQPQETVGLEHRVRAQRIRRLVGEYQISPPPQFHEYVIPAGLMPPDFAVDTPVLRVIFPESTFFDTARSDLLPAAYRIILAMAKVLEGDVPDLATFIAGHCDSRGSEPYNYDLSVARARTVADALRDYGAESPDIWSVGFGESLPLYANADALSMSYNRRVEFLFAARPEAGGLWLKDQMDLACDTPDGDAARKRCLIALKLRPAYVVQQVRPRPRIQEPPTRAGTINPDRRDTVVPQPVKPRQMIINLARRSYLIEKPSL